MIALGAFGVGRRVAEITPEVAIGVEQIGLGAIWLGGTPRGHLREVEALLDATERIPIATGIVNMWRDDAAAVGEAYHRIDDKHPGRFLLGVGIGHRESTRQYRKPYQTMVDYLDQLEEARVPKDRLVLAALGPRALTLSAERTRGAHPFLTTPRHTEQARRVLGEGPLLAPEQKVILESDPLRARTIGRRVVSRYLRLVNYRNSLLREGWTEEDLADGGSDRLVDELVLHGEPGEVVAGIHAHIDAGADHVSIRVVNDDPLASYRQLADLLLG